MKKTNRKSTIQDPLKGFRPTSQMEYNNSLYEIYLHPKNGMMVFCQNGQPVADDLQSVLMQELLERNRIS